MNVKRNRKNRSVFEGSAIKTEVIEEDKKNGRHRMAKEPD